MHCGIAGDIINTMDTYNPALTKKFDCLTMFRIAPKSHRNEAQIDQKCGPQYYKYAIIPGPVAPVQCLAGDCRRLCRLQTRCYHLSPGTLAPITQPQHRAIVTVTASYEYNSWVARQLPAQPSSQGRRNLGGVGEEGSRWGR